MPELPEVESLRRRLSPRLTGHSISQLTVRDAKLWHPAPGLAAEAVAGRRIVSLERHAKLTVFSLEGDFALVLHLKIAGQVVYQALSGERIAGGHPYPLPGSLLPDASTRFIVALDDGAQLFINDQRRFCWLRLLPAAEVAPFVAKHRYGPDPLDASFTPPRLAERLRLRRGRPIKAALLDQTCIAGLGNIYADESLHHARLHPARRAGDLAPEEVVRLHAAIKRVLDLAVPVGGAIVKNGRAEADSVSGRDFLLAHGRAGELCLGCQAVAAGAATGDAGPPRPASPGAGRIVRAVIAGRGTYYCPECQPAPAERAEAKCTC